MRICRFNYDFDLKYVGLTMTSLAKTAKYVGLTMTSLAKTAKYVGLTMTSY